jgi:hypothetical protein
MARFSDHRRGQTDLISNVGSAIDDTGADTGAVGELPGFVINLKKWTKIVNKRARPFYPLAVSSNT